MKAHMHLCAALLIPFIAGCSNVGPRLVLQDRFSYNRAIADSWKEQTLLNIVRLRYLDVPVFLDVASIVSGYSMETTANVGGSFPGHAPDTLSLGATGKLTDRPTITYAPITGQQFNKQFMTPIPPEAIVFLMQAGWPADLILPVTVEAMNGLRGRVSGGMNARPADPEFARVVTLLRELQSSGAVGMSVMDVAQEDQRTGLFFHRDRPAPAIEATLDEITTLLRLRRGVREVEIAYGQLNAGDTQIALLTRSMLQVMLELSAQVDVPPEHVEEGRSVPSGLPEGRVADREGVIAVRSSRSAPEDAFVQVKYRDHWFWVDDRDLASKRTFTFVMLVFSLTETGGKEGLPLVTIPAG